jgi:hypothetical protein
VGGYDPPNGPRPDDPPPPRRRRQIDNPSTTTIMGTAMYHGAVEWTAAQAKRGAARPLQAPAGICVDFLGPMSVPFLAALGVPVEETGSTRRRGGMPRQGPLGHQVIWLHVLSVTSTYSRQLSTVNSYFTTCSMRARLRHAVALASRGADVPYPAVEQACTRRLGAQTSPELSASDQFRCPVVPHN